MYSNILLTHKIVVTLFLLQYLIKFVLLVANKKEALAKYTKATRIAEMIISVAFLVTGIWMLVNWAPISTLIMIKLVCVFVSIPVAIIGFKKGSKPLAALALVLIFASYGLAEVNKKKKAGGKVDTSTSADPITTGKLVYQNGCINCHGADGKLGGSGAKDLSVTVLTIDQQREIIRNGKSAMPGNKDITDEQVRAVILYVGTFSH